MVTDDDDLLEITIHNTQTFFKELNDDKLPEELKFFFQVVLIEVMNLDLMQCKT